MCVENWGNFARNIVRRMGENNLRCFLLIARLRRWSLENGRKFRSRNRRRNVTKRGSCSMTKREDYESVSHHNKESCDKEEEYQPKSEKEE